MEVDGMVPWKTTFLYQQGVFHFHVMCSQSVYIPTCQLLCSFEQTASALSRPSSPPGDEDPRARDRLETALQRHGSGHQDRAVVWGPGRARQV